VNGPVDPARVIVISGPSGAGKTSIAYRLLGDARFARVVTATTRAPRPRETADVDYEFLSAEAFRERLAAGGFLEYAEVYGDLYGTPRNNVRAIRESGRHCVLVVDVQGVETLKAEGSEDLGTDPLYVFVKPPSMSELEARLRSRGGDSDAAIAARLAAAAEEMEKERDYELVLVNDDIERAVGELAEAIGLTLAPRESAEPAEGRS